MSENKSLTLINGLRPFKSKWRLQVKVIRSWKQTPPYADETLEFVLADQTGVKIHATCPRAHMFRTQRNLPLGEWRVIENFKISGVGKGKYRPTSHQYKMTITSETVFTGSDHQDDNPFLTLANYENILNGKENSNVLIDILGHPYDVGAVQIVQVNHEDRKRIQFRMRDISGNNLACCLWGSYAEQIENSVQELDPSNTVWLLRFAKIGEFLGEIQITNAFDASLLDLNPTMAEAVDFKRRIEENSIALPITDKKHDKREIIPHADDWDDVGISMISEISEISELDQTKIVCSVKAIDTDWAWYYFGCTRCKHGVTRLSGKGSKSDKPLFRCPGKCRANVSNVEPRFKLHLIVEDDTGTCKLLLLNSVAKSIVGSEAVDLWDGSYEEIEDPEILPQPIRDLVGKSFCFGITTSSDGADIFKVTQVWSGDIIEKIESQSEPLTQIEGGSSCLSSGGVLLIKENTEPSSDCSTPLSKRKENDADLPDLTSTSKKICLNQIKLEKTKTD
ncbi:replication protein A 70 kDa DNA-binding subunit C-like [Brassica napus]|uniref:replication protein A 70 kDa DNA-binding subunit C-like n=1 Tax=Brassica napus TaxID=3708 RepID=UPI002078CAF0|nr:replication protein A 70 kDa DNA-binding subunit C-like [Brassica napus]